MSANLIFDPSPAALRALAHRKLRPSLSLVEFESASPKARVVSFRMKSRILSVTSASAVPTVAAASAASMVAGSSGQRPVSVDPP